ncbi:MAG: hypothetical protein M3Q45_01410, partial [Chloroflexota bacterium]|nr:hypothetical protein [Chloroflexota bacterium]
PTSDLPAKLGAPAEQALAAAGYVRLEQFTKDSEPAPARIIKSERNYSPHPNPPLVREGTVTGTVKTLAVPQQSPPLPGEG